jgi:hypothetical protein
MFKMKIKVPTKLMLNQETLRNLTVDELRRVEGGFFTQIPVCKTGHTCPECAPPAPTD